MMVESSMKDTTKFLRLVNTVTKPENWLL